MDIPHYFRPKTAPVAHPDAVITFATMRITVLTERLLRLEYAADGQFEDRASQVVWYRQQPVPTYRTNQDGDQFELETGALVLKLDVGSEFSAETLTITVKATGTEWHFGDRPTGNLLGTTRTLDQVSGATRLEDGLISRDGWAVIDDSTTLLFNDDGWLELRKNNDALDYYFIGYGFDYQACLNDYFKIAGRVPPIPRYILGNWWSRYWAYTAQELLDLMDDFRDHDVPLSVCIVDMDWHLTAVAPYNGWTGYTWNRDLFPDPPAFLAALHESGLRTALNLHPALGVRPYEAMYSQMAERLGLDPASGETIAFDLADPQFARAYFELLHHPQEAHGVDFWWIDWQQGELSGLPGLDPLWWLNHLHYYDLARDGATRPFIFSRWGGLGNHRYPIGFSGDTWVNWESLAFQPYFTATAANVGYGWWSHDIGGHMFGVEDPELYARWVQFGVFSPILRLHSTNNPFHERRPWGFDAETLRVTRHALQLRHQLIPYLYTLAWHYHHSGVAPLRPMYHDYPTTEQAYHCPWQYTFGEQIIAAPFIEPAAPDTRLTRQVVWLPAGDWYHFESGEYYNGGRWHAVYGKLGDMPVFARAGAILPLNAATGWGSVDNPDAFEIRVYAGADSQFTLVEDDGVHVADTICTTQMVQNWQGNELTFTIGAATGDTSQIPAQRDYIIRFFGVSEADVHVTVDGMPLAVGSEYDPVCEQLTVAVYEVSVSAEVVIHLQTHWPTLLSHRNRVAERAWAMLETFHLPSFTKLAISTRLDEISADVHVLAGYKTALTPSQMRALVEVTHGIGVHHVQNMGTPDLVILWNSAEDQQFTIQSAAQDSPRIVQLFEADKPQGDWQFTVNYCGLTTVTLGST